MSQTVRRVRRGLSFFLAGMAASGGSMPVAASDHLDAPSVIADPRADIGDLFTWMAPDGRHLNLVMTIVGHTFSDKLAYTFHIDSGRRFERTTATIDLTCRFARATAATCTLGRADRVVGDPSPVTGIVGDRGRFRLFAGVRDDPFFNNVRGTGAMYKVIANALATTARYDDAFCPRFDGSQTAALTDAWRHTDGGPATNFLRGWWPATIVASVDIAAVTRGGPLIAVWASTAGPDGQIDRAARPLTGNALLVTLGSAEVRDAMKERYNRARPSTGQPFVAEIAKGVALYDGLDGHCGDSLLIDRRAPPARRYWPLAQLLADDRLWVNSRSTRCTQLFAVERAARNGEHNLAGDCGGRTVNYDAVNVYRSLLANGTTSSIDDGLHADEQTHSTAVFPFLAAPDSATKVK